MEFFNNRSPLCNAGTKDRNSISVLLIIAIALPLVLYHIYYTRAIAIIVIATLAAHTRQRYQDFGHNKKRQSIASI